MLHHIAAALFVALQSCMAVLFYLQIYGLQKALARNFDAMASDQEAAVSFSYSLKVNQIGLGFKGQAKT
jgi:hypothetical protein